MVSYDRLHALDLGLWGDHTWPLLRGILDKYPNFIAAKFETRYVLLILHYTKIIDIA